MILQIDSTFGGMPMKRRLDMFSRYVIDQFRKRYDLRLGEDVIRYIQNDSRYTPLLKLDSIRKERDEVFVRRNTYGDSQERRVPGYLVTQIDSYFSNYESISGFKI